MQHTEVALKMLEELWQKTDGFMNNASVRVLIKGESYVMGFTAQHRLSTSNHHLYTYREIQQFYSWTYYDTLDRLAVGELPKHLYTAYAGDLREDIDDPLAWDYKTLCDTLLKDYIKLK